MALAAAAVAVAGIASAQTAVAGSGAGKAVIVTGSSRGIGAATAKRLAREGYAVTVNYLTDRDLAARVVADPRAAQAESFSVRSSANRATAQPIETHQTGGSQDRSKKEHNNGASIMAIRDILVLLTSKRDQKTLEAVAALSERVGARTRGVFLTIIPDNTFSDAALSARFAADIITQAREAAAEEFETLQRAVERLKLPVELVKAESFYGAVGETAAMHARYADLAVVSRPSPERDERRAVFEGVLMGAGRPVLLIPEGWRGGDIGANALIGWNASKEAARALHDALPLLTDGAPVTVATVDARPQLFGHGERPGVDMAAHLARHGLKVELRNLDGLGRDASGALAQEAASLGADLIVLGGYGHSRLAQYVFGGVTRDLTATSPVPLLLSH